MNEAGGKNSLLPSRLHWRHFSSKEQGEADFYHSLSPPLSQPFNAFDGVEVKVVGPWFPPTMGHELSFALPLQLEE